jgi:hypothetical protein
VDATDREVAVTRGFLALADESVRAGGARSQTIIIGFAVVIIAAVVYVDVPMPLLWADLIVCLAIYFLASARRLGRVRFTATGIDLGDGSPVLAWGSLESVEYSGSTLRLIDWSGRQAHLPLFFSTNDLIVVVAVQRAFSAAPPIAGYRRFYDLDGVIQSAKLWCSNAAGVIQG